METARGWGVDPGSSKAEAVVRAVSAHHCIPELAAPGWWLALTERLWEDWGAALGAGRGHGEPGV